MSQVPQARIVHNGKIATLTKARKQHACIECGDLIPPPMRYYTVVRGGGGLGWLKFPDRVCIPCVGRHMGLPSEPDKPAGSEIQGKGGASF